MKRRAFTLTEMLVAITVIIVLASLVLAFYPKRESRAATDAASNLQSIIGAAKARAMREGRPVGVRLLTNDGGKSFYATTIISVDEPWAPLDPSYKTWFTNPAASGQSAPALVVFLDLTAGQSSARQVGAPLLGSVEVGDMLEISEIPSIHRITAIDYSTNVMTLASAPSISSTNAVQLGWGYRYTRKARPLMGESPYQLPKDVVISGMTGSMPTSLNIPIDKNGNYQIVFGSSGQAINADAGKIILWIADVNNVAKPTLLAIYSQS